MRKISLITALIVITLITTTSCLNMEKNMQVIEFIKGTKTLPYLKVKINGEVYETDEKGQVLINKEMIAEKIEVKEPYKITGINKKKKETEVECEYIKEKYAGYIYGKENGKAEMKLVLLNLPEAKGVEVIQEPEMKYKDNEEGIKFNKQSQMIDEILKMRLEREDEKLNIYALLDKEENNEIILEVMEVENKINSNIISLKIVDEDGIFIYDKEGNLYE
jgi:hypothetical protein